MVEHHDVRKLSVISLLFVATCALGCGHLGKGVAEAPAAEDSTTGIVRGQIDDGNGNARAGVVVVAIRDDSAGGTRTGISDLRGVYTIKGVSAGRYRLLLLDGEKRVEAGRATVGAGAVHDVDLQVAERTTLAGR